MVEIIDMERAVMFERKGKSSLKTLGAELLFIRKLLPSEVVRASTSDSRFFDLDDATLLK